MSENARKPSIRFAGFDDAWEQRKLGEIADIVRGASPRPIKDPKWFDDKSDIGWLRISDVTQQDGRIHYLEQRISEMGQERTRVLTEPHLLLSIAATVGKPVINYIKTGVHDGFLIFQNPRFDCEFLFQWLEMFRPKWQKFGQPGSQVNLNSDLVKNMQIMLPVEDEQRTIGAFFSNLDNLITLHQRKYDKLVSVKKSLLEKMFPKNGSNIPEIRFSGFTDPWEQRKFIDMVYRISEMSNDIGLPRVEYEDINSGQGKLNRDLSKKFSTKQGVLFQANDVLFGKLRPYLKNWLLADFSGIAVGDFWVLRGFETDSSFIYTLIQSGAFDKVTNQSIGTKMPRADWSLVSNTVFGVPHSKAEQHQIGTFFLQLDNLITLHQRKLEKLKNIKKSMLEKMFV